MYTYVNNVSNWRVEKGNCLSCLSVLMCHPISLHVCGHICLSVLMTFLSMCANVSVCPLPPQLQSGCTAGCGARQCAHHLHWPGPQHLRCLWPEVLKGAHKSQGLREPLRYGMSALDPVSLLHLFLSTLQTGDVALCSVHSLTRFWEWVEAKSWFVRLPPHHQYIYRSWLRSLCWLEGDIQQALLENDTSKTVNSWFAQ